MTKIKTKNRNKPIKKSEIRNIEKSFYPKNKPTLIEWLKLFNKHYEKEK